MNRPEHSNNANRETAKPNKDVQGTHETQTGRIRKPWKKNNRTGESVKTGPWELSVGRSLENKLTASNAIMVRPTTSKTGSLLSTLYTG